MRVRHILVEHKYQAEDILSLLKTGADFQTLAKKFSICSSSKSGGDLGDLSGKNIDDDFKDSAVLLKPGQISGPVRSKFGYHIIQRY